MVLPAITLFVTSITKYFSCFKLTLACVSVIVYVEGKSKNANLGLPEEFYTNGLCFRRHDTFEVSS